MVDLRGKDEILYIDYNQEKSHFAVGTQTGFYIYNIDNGRNSYQGTPAFEDLLTHLSGLQTWEGESASLK
jgi:hypothetical protein